MTKNPKGKDFSQREEGNNSAEIGKVVTTTKASTSITSIANSTPWLRLKDPRIVRVSRVFGGKDRHSKVCTIRGLRDRRVRLSVPTAIQLYDLQARLGLNQPSKVVDWLLNAAKHEIDELPPLPMPMPGAFSLLGMPRGGEAIDNTSASNATSTSQSNDQDQGLVLVKNNNGDHHSSTSIEWELGNNSSSRLARSSSNLWSPSPDAASSDALWRARSKELQHARDQMAGDQKENPRGTRNNISEVMIEKEEENDIALLPRTTNMNHPFFPGMINSIANNMPSGYRWEAPSYPLLVPHLGDGGAGGLTDHNLHSLNIVSLQPSTLSLSTGSQFLFGPTSSNISTTTTSTTQTYFPNISSHGMEIHDPRQFQMLSSNLSVQSLFPNPIRSLFHFGNSTSTNDNIGSPSQLSKERDQ